MQGSTELLLCVALAGFATVAQGADGPSAIEHLEPLAWQVGDWVTEYQATADSGPIKKGDTVSVQFSLRWSPDRTLLVNNSVSEVNGKRIASGMEVIFWNEESSQVCHSYFGTWGTGQGTWQKVGDASELEWKIQGQYGTFTGTAYVTRGNDSWTWQIRKQTHNGKELPDMPLATFHPKAGIPAGDLWNDFRDTVVGRANGEGVLGEDDQTLGFVKGDQFEYRITWRLDLDGAILVGDGDFRIVGKSYSSKSRLVAAWDPSARAIRLLTNWSSGYVEEGTYQRKVGNAFIGTYVEKAPTGQTRRSRVRSEFPDLDSNVLTFLDGPHEGEMLSSFKREKN